MDQRIETSKKIAENHELDEMFEDFLFLKKAATDDGFFKLYFEGLPQHRTYVECFISLNDRYFGIVGEYRFINYDAFRKKLSRNVKK